MLSLEVKNLTKRFMFKKALNDISLTFEKGKIIGLLGPNGSGKTTLMRIVAGLLHKSSGEIIFENDIKGIELKKIVSFMPTESHLYPWMKIKDIINFYGEFFDDFDKDKVYDVVKNMKLLPKIKIGSLSTGQRGRLKVALTVARKADLYLIDEPLNGIDPISRDLILDMLKTEISSEKCIVISSHLVNDFENILDEVIFINDGMLKLRGDVKKLKEEKMISMHELYKEVFKDV